MENQDSTESAPETTVIIPSLDGHRGGMVPRLLESVRSQTYSNYELCVIKGVSPQGRAINQGASGAKGQILIILDDDSRLASESVFQNLVDALKGDDSIGMAGASIIVSPESTMFQKRSARQFPRLITPVVDEITDSDLACHGCCALPRAVFEEVGGEREDIIRGLDPDLRVRLRSAGYRVVLVPDTMIEHPLPDGWRMLTKTFFRNGFGSAYAQKFRPETVYETHEDLGSDKFVAKRSLAYRIARFPLRLMAALLTLKWMRLVAYCAYGVGYVWGAATAKETIVASRDAGARR